MASIRYERGHAMPCHAMAAPGPSTLCTHLTPRTHSHSPPSSPFWTSATHAPPPLHAWYPSASFRWSSIMRSPISSRRAAVAVAAATAARRRRRPVRPHGCSSALSMAPTRSETRASSSSLAWSRGPGSSNRPWAHAPHCSVRHSASASTEVSRRTGRRT